VAVSGGGKKEEGPFWFVCFSTATLTLLQHFLPGATLALFLPGAKHWFVAMKLASCR